MFFNSSLKFPNSTYLCLKLQSNIGCFMMGALILGPTFSFLAALAMDMVYVATLVVSTTTCAIDS